MYNQVEGKAFLCNVEQAACSWMQRHHMDLSEGTSSSGALWGGAVTFM
jgi:hypothetical protein